MVAVGAGTEEKRVVEVAKEDIAVLIMMVVVTVVSNGSSIVGR